MAALVLAALPAGKLGWIETVVVDIAYRGRGIGAELVKYLLAEANAAGALRVNLTSHPSRGAANRLYQRLGFVQRETNLYRFDFSNFTSSPAI